MSINDLSSRDAVLEAMREYDQLGREEFLRRYGYDSAKRYLVEHEGKRYESKALAGVAVGKQFPARGALRNNEFSGGVGTVGRKLTSLGFNFVDLLEEAGERSFGELLQLAMDEFRNERQGSFGKKDALWTAMDLIKTRLLSYVPSRERPYIICTWSLGAGNWLKTPWIALFDRRITTSAQRGIYVVLLVSEDLERVYLTLNQGATELERQQGTTASAATELRARASRYRELLREKELDRLSFDENVDLKVTQARSRNYEYGSVAHILREPLSSITDKEMELDLEQLLHAYEVLAAKLGLLDSPTPAEEEAPLDPQRPTNLILYGPPGTGKTYSTAKRAVELCDGATPAGGHTELFERYKALRAAGRIEFVTFHQSFGYEDFVEGLRPQTGADDSEGVGASGGFRLKAEPGVFKRIAAVAEQSGVGMGGREVKLAHRQFFKMALGSSEQSHIYRAALEAGYIALGYGGEHDWSAPEYDSWQAVFDKWRAEDPDKSPYHGDVVQTFALRGTMKEGDIVVISDGVSKFKALAEVTGPYRYVPGVEFAHQRPVRWLRVFEKSLPLDLISDGKFSVMTLHSLDPAKLKLEALANLLSDGGERGERGEPEPYVLIIDEINRANVSKVFGELITLLEPDKRLGGQNELKVTLPYSKEEFGVPPNLHVIGTMNTADRSIALLDTALRRRFEFEELMPDPGLLSAAGAASGVNLSAFLARLNERIEYLFDREHQVGHAYFMGCVSRADVNRVMRTKVIPLMTEYFYENWERVWQALGEPQDGTDGAFLRRVRLPAPTGAESFGQDRWRYEVKREFSPAAYIVA